MRLSCKSTETNGNSGVHVVIVPSDQVSCKQTGNVTKYLDIYLNKFIFLQSL